MDAKLSEERKRDEKLSEERKTREEKFIEERKTREEKFIEERKTREEKFIEERKRDERPVTCMPRFRPIRASTNQTSSVSLLERAREAVLRLVMLSAASKTVQVRHEKAVTIIHANQPNLGFGSYQLPDSYRSEAIDDCIEFFKRSSAEGKAEIAA